MRINDMRVSLKIAGALLAVFALLCAAGAVILDRTVLVDFERLEMRQHNDDLRRVQARLESTADDMRARVHDYAGWTDTYDFVQGRAPGYVAENFDAAWFDRYQVDLLLFLDDDRRILWGRNRAPAQNAFEQNAAIFYAALTDARRAEPTPEAPAAGTIWTPHGPILFAARPATRNDGAGTPHGLVIIGRFLDREVLKNATQLDLAFTGMNGAGESLQTQRALADIALTDTMDSSWTTPDAVHALIALRAADGRSVGAILTTRPRDVSALGARSIHAAAWMIAGVAVAALLALFALLHWLVIGPIVSLERHIRAETGAPRPLAGKAGNDEIGALAQAYNDLSVRVRAAMVEAEDAALAGAPQAPVANDPAPDRPDPVRGKARAG